MASVGAIRGTSVAWPSSVIVESATASPRIAVTIGIPISTAVPKVASRTITAIVRPTASELSVDGFDSFWPR